MTFHIEYEAEQKLEFDYEALVKRVIDACLDAEECPYECEISILFTDNEEIRRINQEFREIDVPTDVLSFPFVEYEVPGDFSDLENASYDFFNPESGELILGDIILSVDKLLVQAEEFGHSIQRETAFLIAHSMFHLFGYDHMEEPDRIRMEEKQNNVLELLQILR